MRIRLFIIAIAGLLISGYLFVAYTTGGPLVCADKASCDIVRSSQYANLFGLPTPFYGLIFYALLAGGALLATPIHMKRIHPPLYLLTGIGLVVSIWLSYIEQFVLHAWCIWCAASAILSLLAYLVVWLPLWPKSRPGGTK